MISVLFEPIVAWNVPLVSLIFLKRSLVVPILLFSSISLHWSLRKAFLSLLAILWNSTFKWEYLFFSPLLLASLHFTAIYKASSDNHFAFLHFFSMEMVFSMFRPLNVIPLQLPYATEEWWRVLKKRKPWVPRSLIHFTYICVTSDRCWADMSSLYSVTSSTRSFIGSTNVNFW